MQYVCKECNLEFKSLWGLSSHSVQKHKLKPEDLYVKYELNDQKPTCACGCGEVPKFLGIRKSLWTITQVFRESYFNFQSL